MRPARIVRLVFRIFLLVCTLSLSVVSFLGGLSAFNILITPGNVNVDFDSITIDINSSYPERSYLNIPFTITNDGYFDLTDLTITLSINMNYNSSLNKIIYDDIIDFPTIGKAQTYPGNFNATPLSIPEFQVAPPPSFQLNFTLSAWYSLRLLQLTVEIINEEIAYGP